jgi:hypothetical protein
MIFSRNKPQYSVEEIAQQVTNLERLQKLQDMCLQKVIVLRNSESSEADNWAKMAGRYSRNIETGQLFLDHMAEVNSK